MGLDVSLYQCKDLKARLAYEKTLEEKYEAMQYDQVLAWEKENPPPAEAEELEINLPSAKYPNHLFKVGYFRSSYNEGGINSILRNAIGESLYTIFFESGDNREYWVVPDWEASLKRARLVREKYDLFLKNYGPVRVISASWMLSSTAPKSKGEAMALFKAEQERHNRDFAPDAPKRPFSSAEYNWYSNISGDFFLGNGAELLAAIPGKTDRGHPETYLVIRDNPDEESTKDSGGINWYLAALDVVIETIEYVLAQPEVDRKQFYFHWSG